VLLRKRVVVVFGTRPEAIKVAPVIQALERAPWAEPIPVVTAQHRRILDQVLDLFAIRPAHDLDILEPGQTLTSITTRSLAGLVPVLWEAEPDVVVVQGDTTTTLAGALAAFYRRVPVAHLEAGLRTGDLGAPYPEEMNRRVTTQLASLHLAPTPAAKANLLAEGVEPGSVVVTGNTVIDALRWTVGRRIPYQAPGLARLDGDPRRVLLVTAHRRESWGEPMAAIGAALADIARAEPDLLVVFPIHPNPLVRDAILPAVAGLDNVLIVEPLGYGDFSRLLHRATLVLTDSGGVQEEAPSLGKPVLVLRDATERPEAVAAGVARLVGSDRDRITAAVRGLLHDPGAYAAMATSVNPYGDGRAAGRTVNAIARFLGLDAEVDEFGRAPTPRPGGPAPAPPTGGGRAPEAAGRGALARAGEAVPRA
jgi:UDP-N-acetylglucosamine 2-epimerase (non-hydrolysing)